MPALGTRFDDPRPELDEFGEALAADAWAALKGYYAARHPELAGEIREYPTPIARCDVQLSKLLEHRTAVQERLAAMRSLEEHRRSGGGLPSRAGIGEFLATGPATDDALEATLRDRLRASLYARPCLD